MAVFRARSHPASSSCGPTNTCRSPSSSFGFSTSQQIELAGVPVRATRVTYVGELGWELYVPFDRALPVYEAIAAAGARDAGYYAIESLRLEKGYRAFGRELTPVNNPVEAGLLFACKLKTDLDFIGRAAIEEVRARGPQRRLVSLAVTDPAVMMWGGELILRDGAPTGQVTSAAWGATVGSCVGLGYLWTGGDAPVTLDWIRAGSYQANVGGSLVGMTVSTRTLYDPDSTRVRS